MKYTILHISDIHKSEDSDLVNLMQSLKDDCIRYTNAGENSIAKPDFIVVSGDVISGSDSENADSEIISQYKDAEDFLNMLVLEFLSGNKNRIIIVPGNHDINWGVCKNSFTETTDRDASKALFFSGDKEIRWSWKKYSFFHLANKKLYSSRFKHYVDFYNRFFDGIRKIEDCEKEAYIEDVPEINTTFVLFNSCFRVDHLNQAGCICPSALTNKITTIQEYFQRGRLVVGVWHHNVSGLPMQTNYLDYRILDEMMTAGISLGLFGHQHKSTVISKHHNLKNEKDLTLISSGCLYGNSKQLSNGYSRQYNIIEVEINSDKVLLILHVRKDKSEDFYEIPEWNQDLIAANGQLTYSTEIELARPDFTKELSKIDDDVRRDKNFKKACVDIKNLGIMSDRARVFFDHYLKSIDDDAFIADILDDVANDAEAVRLLEAAINLQNPEFSDKVKNIDFIAESEDPMIVELRLKI